MFLVTGVLALSIGIIAVLHIYIFRRLPGLLSKIIDISIGIASIFTLTVHGIWLGLTIIILGLLWLYPKKAN